MFSFDKKRPPPAHTPAPAPKPRTQAPSKRGPRANDSRELTRWGRPFGADFSSVRLHRDSLPDAAGAVAFTKGEDVHISPSIGPLSSEHAQGLLVHELAHVVQQRAGAEGVAPQPERRAESLADAAAAAAVRGEPIPALGAAPSGVAQHKKRPVPPGGRVLYIGMNNYKPEVAALSAHFFDTEPSVTTVTVSDTHRAFVESDDVYADTYDLDTAEGRFAFCRTLPTNGEVIDACAKLLARQGDADRDDVAHVMQVYAQTEHDGLDRMSRVVLSGHSTGGKIYHHDEYADVWKGTLQFDTLVELAKLFSKAAGQTRHLMVIGCVAGDISSVNNYYLKAFPNLVTFSGWSALCPTGKTAGADLQSWLRLTDKDPKTLPLPPSGRSTWSKTAGYKDENFTDDDVLIQWLRDNEDKFQKYFVGDLAPDAWLTDYYTKANAARGRSGIQGAERTYARRAFEQSFRLRKWDEMLPPFWEKHGSTLSAAGVPDISKMKRKPALQEINKALGRPGFAADFAAAATLLTGLRDLTPDALPETREGAAP